MMWIEYGACRLKAQLVNGWRELSPGFRRRLLNKARIRSLPYGYYHEYTGTDVLFNRFYQPIARFRMGRFVEWVNPDTTIKFHSQTWFYRDSDSPLHNRKTRHRLEKFAAEMLPSVEGGA